MRRARTLVRIIVVVAGSLLCWRPGLTNAEPPQAATQVESIDKVAWAQKLAELKDDDWRGAFQVGANLARLPPDEGFRILQENWQRISKLDNRQQMLKAWHFAAPFPFHPRLLDALDLGMRDESPQVRGWASNYLGEIALQDFSEDIEACKTWYAANRGKTMDQIAVASVRRFVAELAAADVNEPLTLWRRKFPVGFYVRGMFLHVPEARQAALDAGILKITENLVVQAHAPKPSPGAGQLAAQGLAVIGELKVGEEDLKRLVLPVITSDADSEFHWAAVQALERKEFPWVVDVLTETLTQSLFKGGNNISVDRTAAGVLAKIGAPRAIPAMIGVIDADNSGDTVSGVGYYGLAPLTGVEYSAFHDGPWWRRWWTANRQKFPETVRVLSVPDLKKTEHGSQHIPFPDDIDTLEGKLRLAGEALAGLDAKRANRGVPRVSMSTLAQEVAVHADPHSIPVLIGIIDADNSYDTVYGVGYFGLWRLTKVDYSPFHDGSWWHRWWESHKSQFDGDVQAVPIPVFNKTEHGKTHVPFPDDMDMLQGQIRFAAAEFREAIAVRNQGHRGRISLSEIADEIAKHKDPRAIPYLIGLVAEIGSNDPSNAYQRALSSLTGVKYDKTPDDAWWREWWQDHKADYPQDVRAIEIPDFESPLVFAWKEPTSEEKQRAADEKKQAEDKEALADVADVPALDLTIGGDKKMRYFLVGAAIQAAPDEPYGLLVVLPGGDGSAEFNPFMRRIYKNVLGRRWLLAQAVAPQWNNKRANEVVWPTVKLTHPAAKFTTEEFIEAIITDVRAKAKIDARRIFLLGWSSGGPPCYAAALRKETPVTGTLIAMSVFKPEQMPAIENAKGRAFYLLQSPDDRVTPIRFAVDAEKTLGAAGAKVQLQRYNGGHGWQGNVWKMIGDGIRWLEKPASAAASEGERADKTAANILLNPSFEDGDESPAEWSQGAELDGVEYSWDKNAAQKGKASLCLNKTANRYFPIAQWFQIVERKTDSPSLQVSAQVKAERVSKAIIDVIFLDEDAKPISHEWVAYIGAKEAKDPPANHDWKKYAGKVKIPARTRKLQICLQIYGPGKVWFDEIRAEYVE